MKTSIAASHRSESTSAQASGDTACRCGPEADQTPIVDQRSGSAVLAQLQELAHRSPRLDNMRRVAQYMPFAGPVFSTTPETIASREVPLAHHAMPVPGPAVVQRVGSDDDDDDESHSDQNLEETAQLPRDAAGLPAAASRTVTVGRFQMTDEGEDSDAAPSPAPSPQVLRGGPDSSSVMSGGTSIGRFQVYEEDDENDADQLPASVLHRPHSMSSSSGAAPSAYEPTRLPIPDKAGISALEEDEAPASMLAPPGLLDASSSSASSHPRSPYLAELHSCRPKQPNSASNDGRWLNCLLVAAAAIVGKTTTQVMVDLGYDEHDFQHSNRFLPPLLRGKYNFGKQFAVPKPEFADELKTQDIRLNNDLVLPVAADYVVSETSRSGRYLQQAQVGSLMEMFPIAEGIAMMKGYPPDTQYIVYLEKGGRKEDKKNEENEENEEKDNGDKTITQSVLHFVYAENDNGQIRFIDYQPFFKRGIATAPVESIDAPTPPPVPTSMASAVKEGFERTYFVAFYPVAPGVPDGASSSRPTANPAPFLSDKGITGPETD